MSLPTCTNTAFTLICSFSCGMESPYLGQRKFRPVLLPTICEYREFRREEDYYQETVFNSKLMKTRNTRNGYTKLTQRFEDEDSGPEEERPLLTIYKTQANKVGHGDSESKPKRVGKWKMQKKRVKLAWPKRKRRRALQASLRSSVKALSPLLLLRTMRDAYVRALNRLGNKCTHRPWYTVGARAM